MPSNETDQVRKGWRSRLRRLRSSAALGPTKIIASRVLLVLVGLFAFYLLVANTLLLTPLLRSAVSSSDDVKVKYAWAISYLPGRVYFRELALRIEDYNIQAAIDIERGQVDVDLLALTQRKFQALWVDVEGVRFKMRHKLSKVGDQGRRLEGYPKIPEFKDPPLYVGPTPEPVSDSNDKLWDLQLQNVKAKLIEVWILEYRLEGAGVAGGGFLLRPGRYVVLDPCRLDIEGKVTLAQTVVAQRASIHLSTTVSGFDPRSVTGIEPMHHVNAAMEMTLREMDLGFTDVYGASGRKVTGTGNLDADLKLEAGVIAPGSMFDFEANAWQVEQGHVRVSGEQSLKARLRRIDGDDPVRFEVTSTPIVVESRRAADLASPTLEDLIAHVDVTPNLAQNVAVLRVDLVPAKIDVPDLEWVRKTFELEAVKTFTGRASMELQGERDAQGLARGAVRLDVSDAKFVSKAAQVDGSLRLDTQFEGTPDAVRVREVLLRLSSTRLGAFGRKSDPVNASIISRDLVVGLGASEGEGTSRVVKGAFTLRANRVSALLPLLGDSFLVSDVPAALLGDAALEAQARVDWSPGRGRFDLVHASAGLASARGYLERSNNAQRGAFLVVTPYANIGFEILRNDVNVKPFVDEKWLPRSKQASGKAAMATW